VNDPQRPVLGDPDRVNPPQPSSDMGTTGHGSRLLPAASAGSPVQQLTPDQRYFRDSVANGRWQADFDAGANAPANRMLCHDDGTVDTMKLEADGDQWIDLGGRGATDFAVGRP
jgi:hypothetical protein